MDRDDDGETSYKYNTFVDDVAFEPTYLQALPTAAGRNVATCILALLNECATAFAQIVCYGQYGRPCQQKLAYLLF